MSEKFLTLAALSLLSMIEATMLNEIMKSNIICITMANGERLGDI